MHTIYSSSLHSYKHYILYSISPVGDDLHNNIWDAFNNFKQKYYIENELEHYNKLTVNHICIDFKEKIIYFYQIMELV